jgi:lipid II:glycine glycyltransferase (peptidoglycan interpeptide bridge formation enzyme)
MHYHLSGTLLEYRNLASANLLLYEASCWAANRGIGLLHLGGGLEEDDNLFGFKKQFNKNGYADFYIGKTIFVPDRYEELLDIREKNNACFDRNNSRMIQYRR